MDWGPGPSLRRSCNMAYSIPIPLNCQEQNCKRMATEEVFNNRNAHMGRFCRTCAKKKVERLNELEAPKPAPPLSPPEGEAV